MIHVHEPFGERALNLPVRIGGDRLCNVLVPGAKDAERVTIDHQEDVLRIRIDGDVPVRVNNGWMAPGAFRELLLGDVIFLGSARVQLRDVGLEPSIVVTHSASNATIEPVRALTALGDDDVATEEIVPADLGEVDAQPFPSQRPVKNFRVGWIIAIALTLLVALVTLGMHRIAVDVDPVDARVHASGISWHAGNVLYAMPGMRTLRVSREGYESSQQTVRIGQGGIEILRVRLQPLPGRLSIDTGGIAATVFVDGVQVGRAPGEIALATGTRTVTLRAPRYLDLTRRLQIKGAGEHESLRVVMQSHWGEIAVSVNASQATLAVDDQAPVTLPATVDAPAGLRRLTIRAPGAKVWQGAVLLKGGQTLSIGPLTLGAPDATLRIVSSPSGADVSVAGTFRGRTPQVLSLPAGLPQEITVERAGYGSIVRNLVPGAGQKLAWSLELPVVAVKLLVQGKPVGAVVQIDGLERGKAPLEIELPAIAQTLKVSAPGYQDFETTIDLSAAAARRVDYELTLQGKPAGWKAPAAQVESPLGIALRLLPSGTFALGSERREQGRRANETPRVLTFARPVYIATREITNGQFRKFRDSHASGFVDKRSIDLDAMPVTGVTWADAVTFCNWLSEREGLPPAYEQRDGQWVLRQPVTSGYRLPSEGEWELAARYAGAERKTKRYDWGDTLPPPAGSANLAGGEAATSLPTVLEAWQDDYPAVAPVGKFAPNALGLQDMVGNVTEWVQDFYASYDTPSSSTDYLGPASGSRHVIKGSSWRTATYAELRAAWRDGAEVATQEIGFRVARYAE